MKEISIRLAVLCSAAILFIAIHAIAVNRHASRVGTTALVACQSINSTGRKGAVPPASATKSKQAAFGKATASGIKPAAAPASSSPKKPRRGPLYGIRIVLDAGHGGRSSGAVSCGIQEQDLTLAMTLKLATELKKRGARVYLTRATKKTVELADRTAMSNQLKPNLFVSIHMNASNNTKADGIETFYFSAQGGKIARAIFHSLVHRLGALPRYVHKRNLYVCKGNRVPATLVEVGYMTNPKKRKKLVNPRYQKQVAVAIAEAVVKYVHVERSGQGRPRKQKGEQGWRHA